MKTMNRRIDLTNKVFS